MTSSIRKTIPTQLEAEYKKLVEQNAKKSNNASSSEDQNAAISPGRQVDTVTLSLRRPEIETATSKLKPSKPVEHSEKQALQSHFSVYG